MIRIEKTQPRFARAGPPPVEPRESAVIEGDRSCGQSGATRNTLMQYEQDRKREHGNWQQPVVPPGENAAGDHDDQSPNAYRSGSPVEVFSLGPPALEPAFVFRPQTSVYARDCFVVRSSKRA